MAKKAQKEEGQVMSEADRLVAQAKALPLPEATLTGGDALVVVSKTHGHIARGLPRKAVEKLLLVGKDDITPGMAQQAAQLLGKQLAQYQREASAVIAQAESVHQATMGELKGRQREIETQREEFLGEIGAVIEEYQELLQQTGRIKGYFKPEFEAAAVAAKPEAPKKESRWAPVASVLGGLRQKAEGLVYTPVPKDERLSEKEEAQVVEDIEAIAVYVDPAAGFSRGMVLDAIQNDIGWTIPQMVSLVLEAEAVFDERVREAKGIRDDQSQQLQVLLRQIEGGIAAAEGALTSLAQKKDEIAKAVQVLEAKIAAVQEMFPA